MARRCSRRSSGVAAPKEIVISALGVREGLLYSQLPPEVQAEDPLIAAAREFNRLRSRAPAHGEELFDWTSRASSPRRISRRPTTTGVCVTPPACFPTFPGAPIPTIAATQAYDLVANAAFIGVDHPSRAFLALAAAYRHLSNEDFVTPQSRSLVSARQLDRARILGAAMRVAYNISAAMPGVLPRAPMVCGQRPGCADPAGGACAAQQRPAAVPDAAVRPADRRRPRDPGVA